MRNVIRIHNTTYLKLNLFWPCIQIYKIPFAREMKEIYWIYQGRLEPFFFEYIGTATLDILFRQITMIIKVCVVFVFGLLTVVPFWFSNRSIVSKSFSLFAVTKIHNHDSKIGLKLLIILKNQPERIKNELISIGKKAK